MSTRPSPATGPAGAPEENGNRLAKGLFRNLLEAAPDAMVVADSGGRIVVVNTQVEKLFGWPRDELIGEPVEKLIPGRYRTGHVRHRSDYAKAPHTRSMGAGRNLSGLRRDGTEFPVDVSLSPLSFRGEPLVIAAVRDITDRRRAESERDAFFRLSLDMLCTATFDGYFQQLNPVWEKVLGWTLDELRAKPFIEFVHPDDRERTRNEAGKLAAGGRTVAFENRYRRKDGTYRTLLWTGAASAELKLMVATARDITDLRHTERILEESGRRLADAQEIAHVGSWDWDIPTNRVTWSDELYRIYGHAPGAFEVTYENFLERIHPDDRDQVDQAVKRAYAAGRFEPFDHRIVRPDGSLRVLHAEGRVEHGADGAPVRMAGIGQDITERKETEAQLAARAEALARSNEELEQFAYVASHDLQEPLRTVASYTQLLERRYADTDANASAYTGYIVEGVRRMQALIEDLLAYSRVARKSDPFRAVDLNAVLAQALANLGAAMTRSGATVTHDDLPQVRGDPGQLAQLLQNLVANALKFRGSEATRIHVGARHEAGQWTISVADNGIGIDPAHFDKIFVIFQRLHTRDTYPGTGIGLALCKKIVTRHGGRIWVHSDGAGKGATFLFTLPEQAAPG